MRTTKHSIALTFLLIALLWPVPVQAAPVSLDFALGGPFSIFGHLPVPQVDGFDYAITDERVEFGLAGQSFNITGISLTADGVSLGARLNFDVEIHLSGTTIGLPAGQSFNTLVDPVTGFSRVAESQLRIVVGDIPFTGSFDLNVDFDGTTDSVVAAPSLASVKALPNKALTLSDGLHVQIFLWTADNRNVKVDFDNLHLRVEGDASEGLPEPVPEPSTIPLDIKPQSCPNPFNVKSRGVIPVAILGTFEFDVTQVDIASVRLEGVPPHRSAIEDVASPFEPFDALDDALDCTTEGPDSLDDLTLKFRTQEIVAALGEVADGDVLVLTLTGNLKDEFGGTPFQGQDVVVIKKKGKNVEVIKKKGKK